MGQKSKVGKDRLKPPKRVYFVYANGYMDFMGNTLAQAKDMATHPETGSREDFSIERWVLKKGKFEFDRRIQ